MSDNLKPSEELAAIHREVKAMRAAKIEPWWLACHMIGRQQVSYLFDHGLAIVSRKEYEAMEAMKEQANTTEK